MTKKIYNPIKRFVDIIFALMFIIVFSPVYIITCLVIYFSDFHNPIYIQDRVGYKNKLFGFIKFRSMVANADDILFKDKELYKQMRSGNNKVKDDPRVTKFGRFIRKYSIDEFPQMFNVILGDMTVVGPRALRPDEMEDYRTKNEQNDEKLKVLTSVKPGITGYWQVSGRSNIDFDERIDMECYYAKNYSLMFDLKIMIKTPLAVIKGDGAY